MTTEPIHLATVHLDSGDAPYRQTVRAGHHAIVADEPVASGGGDQGMAPYALLLSALAACTAMTLQMYAARKGWALGAVHVDAVMHRDGEVERIERTIALAAPLSAEQRARLGEIAEKTPVTRTLKRATTIATTLR